MAIENVLLVKNRSKSVHSIETDLGVSFLLPEDVCTIKVEEEIVEKLFTRNLDAPELGTIDKEMYREIFLTEDSEHVDLLGASVFVHDMADLNDDDPDTMRAFYVGIRFSSRLKEETVHEIKKRIFIPFAEEYSRIHSRSLVVQSAWLVLSRRETETIEF